MGTNTNFSLYAVLPGLLGLGVLVALIVVAVVVGKRAPHVRMWLWMAPAILFGGSIATFVIELVANQAILGQAVSGDISDAQVDQLTMVTASCLGLRYLFSAATFSCYCVAVVKAARA